MPVITEADFSSKRFPLIHQTTLKQDTNVKNDDARTTDAQVLGVDGPRRVRPSGLRLLLRRRDPPDDVADCDHGGDHQRHPSGTYTCQANTSQLCST